MPAGFLSIFAVGMRGNPVASAAALAISILPDAVGKVRSGNWITGAAQRCTVPTCFSAGEILLTQLLRKIVEDRRVVLE